MGEKGMETQSESSSDARSAVAGGGLSAHSAEHPLAAGGPFADDAEAPMAPGAPPAHGAGTPEGMVAPGAGTPMSEPQGRQDSTPYGATEAWRDGYPFDEPRPPTSGSGALGFTGRSGFTSADSLDVADAPEEAPLLDPHDPHRPA
jgi:hypothetical protein